MAGRKYEFHPEVMAAIAAAIAAAGADIEERFPTWADSDRRFIGYGLIDAAVRRAYLETVARLRSEGRLDPSPGEKGE